MQRIGEDVSEKLNYTPGVFHVERHIRGKWACSRCQTLLWANHQSQLAGEALKLYGGLYEVERDLQEVGADQRYRIRQLRSRPIADTLTNG